MEISVVLLCIQSILLVLYGVPVALKPQAEYQRTPMLGALVFLVVAVVSVAFAENLRGIIYAVLFALLLVDYTLGVLAVKRLVWAPALVGSTIVAVGGILPYYHWQHWGVGLSTLGLMVMLAMLARTSPKILSRHQDFFRKSGTLLTFFFLVEPTLISVQQNVKPVATIPIDTLAVPQSLTVLGVLLVLVLGGFLWKKNKEVNL